MSTDQHPAPPPDPAPQPSRRDDTSPAAGHHGPTTPICDCAGCAEFRAIHGRVCAEVPAEQREIQRAIDFAAQQRYSGNSGPMRRAS